MFDVTTTFAVSEPGQVPSVLKITLTKPSGNPPPYCGLNSPVKDN